MTSFVQSLDILFIPKKVFPFWIMIFVCIVTSVLFAILSAKIFKSKIFNKLISTINLKSINLKITQAMNCGLDDIVEISADGVNK